MTAASATRAPSTPWWLRALIDPAAVQAWTPEQWEEALRVTRRLRLLGRLAEAVDRAGLLPAVPAQAARHLLAEQRYARWRMQNMAWLLERLPHALGDLACPLVLLKGAAYMGQGLDIGQGRLPSDVDILVPFTHIAEAQARLAAQGWRETALDAHDQRYYREWSHELPPMHHDLHGLELDLHHNILPPVARTRVDAALLLARLQPSRWPAWQVLAPEDQVLHSAAHLFHDSEHRERLRDLVDLDGLFRHFGGNDLAFWPRLAARANELGLQQSLALATHFCHRWLDTPIPDPFAAQVRRQGLPHGTAVWLLPLFASVLWPSDPDRLPPRRQAWAAQALLVRHHWGRMPLNLLLPHLWRKWRLRVGRPS